MKTTSSIFCLLFVLLATNQAIKLRSAKEHSAKNTVQMSQQIQFPLSQAEIASKEQGTEQEAHVSLFNEEQNENLRMAQNADVFIFNADGKNEFLGRMGDADVQTRVQQGFQESIQNMEKEQLEQMDQDNKVVDDAQPKAFELDFSSSQVVQEDNSMRPQSEVVQEAQQQELQHADLPYVINFVDTPVHFYDEEQVTLEELAQKNCVFLFSECGFRGKNLASCSNFPMSLAAFPEPIASIYIPEGAQFTVIQELDDRSLTYTESVQCLDNYVSLVVSPSRLELMFQDGKVLQG